MKHSSEDYEAFMANLPDDPRDRSKVFSAVVRGAMKQITADFTTRIAILGFKRKRDTLLWSRPSTLTVDNIGLQRSGSTYGAPINASVSLKMSFSIAIASDSSAAVGISGGNSDKLRTPAGKPYHLRFNAVTGDSYDKVLDNLLACLTDHGEPGFATYRGAALLNHPVITPEAAARLKSAIKGKP